MLSFSSSTTVWGHSVGAQYICNHNQDLPEFNGTSFREPCLLQFGKATCPEETPKPSPAWTQTALGETGSWALFASPDLQVESALAWCGYAFSLYPNWGNGGISTGIGRYQTLLKEATIKTLPSPRDASLSDCLPFIESWARCRCPLAGWMVCFFWRTI